MKQVHFISLMLCGWAYNASGQYLTQIVNPFFSYNLYRYNPAATFETHQYGANLESNFFVSDVVGMGRNVNMNSTIKINPNNAVGLNINSYLTGEGDIGRGDLNFSYAHQFKVGKTENAARLSTSLQGGLSTRSVTYYSWGSGWEWKTYGNLNIGAYLYFPKHDLYIGATMNDILQTYTLNPPYSAYFRYHQLMTGYRFKIGKGLSLQPNVLINHRFNSLISSLYNSFEVNMQLQSQKWETGLNYSSTNLIGVNAGVHFAKRFQFRIAYNNYMSRLNSLAKHNVTIMLAYRSLK